MLSTNISVPRIQLEFKWSANVLCKAHSSNISSEDSVQEWDVKYIGGQR